MMYKNSYVTIDEIGNDNVASIFCEPHYSGRISMSLLKSLFLNKTETPIVIRNIRNESKHLIVYQAFADFLRSIQSF